MALAHLTTFYGFVSLPAEIQLDIWEFAYAAAEKIPGILCFNLQGIQSSEDR